MNKKVNLTVNMEVTIPQALALKAMFEYWNHLSKIGSSRNVGFFVDGDGNFHPKCEIITDIQLPELTDELRNMAIESENNGIRLYDYDEIAWYLSK